MVPWTDATHAARRSPRGLKRAREPGAGSKAGPCKQRKTTALRDGASALQRAQLPVSKPWPCSELFAFDLPEAIGWGPLLRDVLIARGWKFSGAPCHVALDTSFDIKPGEEPVSLVYPKEFEASLRGKTPAAYFGKEGAVQEGYRLQPRVLPPRALWMMGWSRYVVPGTFGNQLVFREDFPIAVAKAWKELAGGGNYRMFKIPGVETALYKTNLSAAFRDEPWFPECFVLPREKSALLAQLKGGKGYWIAKPKNDYGGTGIKVWKGSDPALAQLVRDCDGQLKSVVQRYLPDPYLVEGYKFHLRIHMLITNLDPLEAFVQENGQVLFATKPYTLKGSTLGENFEPPVHVTNMCLNATSKNKENFFREKPVIGSGQQFRVQKLHMYLAAHHPGFDKNRLWRQILNICAETARYISKAPSVRQHGPFVKDRHLELLGMDIMLDKHLNACMCEANTDPGLDYPDRKMLGESNPDYPKETELSTDTWNDVFTLLGLDCGKKQKKGSLKSWYKVDFDRA